jgi:hypothetical protein
LVKLKLPPLIFFFLHSLAFTEMPLQFTVKHTFIDDFSSDSEEECTSLVKSVRTCPSVIITPPDCSEEKFSTPTCNGSNDDSEEDDEVDGEAFFYVKTMNSYSPHPAKQQRLREMRTRLLSKDMITPVADSPGEQLLAGKERQCVCGHVFMLDAKFCSKCGKERCCQAAAPVQQCLYECACGNVLLPDESFCCKCGKERCQTAGHQVLVPCLLPVMPLVAFAAEARPPSAYKTNFVEEVEDASSGGNAGEMSTEKRQPEVSQGALLHASGTCKPCGFFWKSQGCEFGKECLHCHLCPKGELKNRMRKAKRSARQAELKASRKQREQEK